MFWIMIWFSRNYSNPIWSIWDSYSRNQPVEGMISDAWCQEETPILIPSYIQLFFEFACWDWVRFFFMSQFLDFSCAINILDSRWWFPICQRLNHSESWNMLKPLKPRWDLRKAVWPHIAERIFLAIYFVEVVLRAFADGSPRVTQSLTWESSRFLNFLMSVPRKKTRIFLVKFDYWKTGYSQILI